MADAADEVYIRQTIESLKSFRAESSPLLPWQLIAKPSDENPFMGYEVGVGDQWNRSTYKQAVDDMYSKMPGSNPAAAYTYKQPDRTKSAPDLSAFRKLFPQPLLQLNTYKRKDQVEVSTNILELSETLSDLLADEGTHWSQKTGKLANPHHSTEQARGWEDRKKVEEARKRSACLVASRLMLCDKSVSLLIE
jgi:hypothetical protein